MNARDSKQCRRACGAETEIHPITRKTRNRACWGPRGSTVCTARILASSGRRCLCYAVLLPLIFGCASRGSARTPDEAKVVKDFEARISNYMELRKREGGTPRPTDSASKLEETRDQLAQKIRSARADAKQGDIFTPEIAAYFRHQIASTLGGHDGKKIRASLHHAEPVQGVPLQVNARYPQEKPLQSTPPTLLLNLPHLPQELQYRIAGQALLLYDSGADLIVDFLPDAMH